jgi:Na+-translocating ferredoxin:NAD+ oxidoreductase RnfD subunit
MLQLKSIKSQLILYLACFAIFLSVKDKDAIFLAMISIAVISSLVIESSILYFKTKIFQITESSIITGLIIGYVLSSDEGWLRFVLASSLAVLSKYLIRFRKKHIFNPAAFGIFLTLIFLGAATQWKGTYVWYILLPFGFYFVEKIKKIEIIIGYALVSLALFGIQAFLQKIALWHIFGYLSYFYIFVMVIEPKTTPMRPMGKFFFGAGVAMLIFILTELGAKFDVELFSLLILNITVPILNKIPYRKGGLA